MTDEMISIEEREVWEVVDCPPDRKPVRCRWVFDTKSDGRKCARLVAKGFSKMPGVDYDETFSPVSCFETVRLLFAIAALEDWDIQALDVKTAFLYGKLDEEIYMDQPEGFIIKGQERKVYKLKKALYGLKQASLAWYNQAHKSLTQLGFRRCFSDTGLYIRDNNQSTTICVLYVDDIMFMGSSLNLINNIKSQFMKIWECRDLGPVKEYLGMCIIRSRKMRYLFLIKPLMQPELLNTLVNII